MQLLLERFGGNNVQVNEWISCLKGLYPAIERAFALKYILIDEPSDRAKIIILETALGVTEALQKCERQIDFTFAKRGFESFMGHPLKFALKGLVNAILERYTIVKANLNQDGGNDPVITGKNLAKIVKAYLNDIVF